MKKYIYVLLVLGAFITLSIFALKYKNLEINASNNTETINKYNEIIIKEKSPENNNELNNSGTIKQINNKQVPAIIITNTPLQWPISSNIISQYYHESHKAIDFTATNQKENIVYATENGIIKEVDTGYNDGYGIYILIEHENNLSTHYSHLDKLFVKEDDTINREDTIAIAGNTGQATKPHLHFEVRNEQSKLNPLDYIK